MRVDVTPRQVELVPGQPVVLTVTITNTTTVIGGYRLRVLGADPSWVHLGVDQVSLFPDEVRVVTVTVAPPPGLAAGVRRIAVQVRELTPPEDSAIAEVDLTVPAAASMHVRVDPMAVTAGRRATFSILAENTGNTTVVGRLAGDDPEGKVRFAFEPEVLQLAPGEHAVVDLQARARRNVTGAPAVRLLSLYLDEAPGEVFFADPLAPAARPRRGDDAAIANATFVQKAVLSRGSLSLVGLLAAVTVFALVITLALGKLVGQSTADRNLALQVAAARAGGTASGTSGLAGTVHVLGSGNPLGAVSVSVFDAADTTKPLLTTATDGNGRYTVAQLPAGKYKIEFQRAGYVASWYPAATSDAEATTVQLAAGQVRQGLDVQLGGVPASISGTVVGDDVSASTIYLETDPGASGGAGGGASPHAGAATPLSASGAPTGSAPTGSAPTGSDPVAAGAAIVQKAAVGSDGSFSFTGVPSPSVYELVVIKTGYATTTQQLDVGGGENRTGVQLTLRKGDGLISGTVSDPTGPQGNATITATAGQTTVTTVSLTDAASKGKFTLQGLPTPGTFTVTASLPGHASQTMTLTLAAGQKLTGVQITLGTSSGALDGIVDALPANRPAGGVTVSATDGLLTIQTETDSSGDAGHWHIGGLPVPGTYTLTFSRGDLISQTVSVSLDANGAVPAGSSGTAVDAAGLIHVAMQPSTTTLSGTVTRTCATTTGCTPGPLGEATVTLNSGSSSYTVTTASTPDADRGHYEIDGLPGGTYTLTVSAGSGTSPYSQVLKLTPGRPGTANVQLASPAGVLGVLQDAGGAPLSGWSVFLYPAADYPTTVARTVQTGADGSFRLDGVDAGDYLIAMGPTTDPAVAVKTVRFTVRPSEQKDLGTLVIAQ